MIMERHLYTAMTMALQRIYDAQTMEVKSGLTAGDQVITTWSNELVDGQEVLIDSDNGQNENAAQGESAAENAGEETQKAGE